MKSYITMLVFLTGLFLGREIFAQNLDSRVGEVSNKLVGSKLPDCEFETIDGRKIDAGTTAGKILIMNFCTVNESVSATGIPALNKLFQKYKNQPDVVFLVFTSDNKEKIKEIFGSTRPDYSIVANAAIYEEILGIYKYPTQLVVNKKGIITKMIVGGDGEDEKAAGESIAGALR
jgi:hypothetical protein